MTPSIVLADSSHIPLIAANVRHADREELKACSGRTPAEVMALGLAVSEVAWTGLVDGVPVCMFGVAPAETEGIGRPWMIGTKLLERYQMVFLRRCRKRVELMHAFFPLLENWVDARNEMAIKWLSWLGFTFDLAAPAGVAGMPFHRFERRR
jgi:hypothetical protein